MYVITRALLWPLAAAFVCLLVACGSSPTPDRGGEVLSEEAPPGAEDLPDGTRGPAGARPAGAIDDTAPPEGMADEDCDPAAAARVECTFDEGEGTRCTVTFEQGAAVRDVCTGPWGSSACQYTASGSVCDYSWEGGACREEYDASGALLASTCDDGGGGDAPPAECSEGDDGLVTCVSDEGQGTTCTSVLDGEALVSQQCAGPWGSSDCRPSGAGYLCVYTWEGGSCQEELDASGAVQTSTCGDPGGEAAPGDGEAPVEQCTEGEGGAVTCVFDDGAGTVCTSELVADVFVRDTCVGPWGTSVCVPSAAGYHCDYAWEGGSCSEEIGPEGTVLASTCESADGGAETDAGSGTDTGTDGGTGDGTGSDGTGSDGTGSDGTGSDGSPDAPGSGTGGAGGGGGQGASGDHGPPEHAHDGEPGRPPRRPR